MIYDYIKTLDKSDFNDEHNDHWSLFNLVSFFDNNEVDLSKYNIAIIGVKDDRGTKQNIGAAEAPDEIRQAFYKLKSPTKDINLIDMGNIERGSSVKDTYFALTSVLSDLLKEGIFTIILGGGQDLSFAQFNAYETLGRSINFVSIDEKLDLDESMPDNQKFLMDVFTKENNHLFNFTNIGHQSYYVHDDIMSTMEKMNFDCFRLGHFKNNIKETEIVLRDADMISFDFNAIKCSDAPARANASPNGFYSEDICQIARYAGISDKVSSFGIYEMNPSLDINNHTSQLAGQMMWYIIEGYYNRHFENPKKENNEYLRFVVDLKSGEYDLIFWKSKKSGRWWMEVPFSSFKQEHEKHHLVSCTYQDYQDALNGEIPNRWINAYEKLC